MEAWMLTDEEMAEVQGDKERCLAVIGAFDTCQGCSANCHAVAQAQADKMIREGFKSPETILAILSEATTHTKAQDMLAVTFFVTQVRDALKSGRMPEGV